MLTVAITLAACTKPAHHPAIPAYTRAHDTIDVARLLAEPGPLGHEAVKSADWAVPLAGLVNLDHPEAAGLKNGDVPMVLPVHVLTHPQHGVWIVDTGITRDRAGGGHGAAKGLVRGALSGIEPVEPLGDILERQDGALAGVLITHAHLDHILGLPDVPVGTPLYVGEHEFEAVDPRGALIRPTTNAAFEGHAPARTWNFSERGVPLGPVERAVDVIGDGSLWALSTPGHTPGSTSFLARTTDGPVLFTGDACHTIWGWEHGVEPGKFSEDGPTNAASLAQLKALVEAYPSIRVYTGHELDGEGTGVDDMR